MSAHEAEAMVDSMIRDSPLPNLERATDEIPEDGGSDKLPEEDGEKLPEGGGKKQPEEAPAGKSVPFCTFKKYVSLLLI